MIDKNSNIYEIVEALKTKDSISATVPYPYLSGLCWSLLNETQRKKLAKMINEMENK